MKKLSLLFALILVLSACQAPVEPVDIEAEKALLNEMFAKYEAGFIAMETDSILSLYSEEFLICGTDPGEFWDRELTRKYYDDQREDFTMNGGSLPEITFIGDRVINLAPDGKSALVIEQMNVAISPGISWRQAHYVLKEEGIWRIAVSNFGIIPKNEDLPEIIMAVASKNMPAEK